MELIERNMPKQNRKELRSYTEEGVSSTLIGIDWSLLFEGLRGSQIKYRSLA